MGKYCVAAASSNKEVIRTRDHWRDPLNYSVLCEKHFIADFFESDSAIAVTMG